VLRGAVGLLRRRDAGGDLAGSWHGSSLPGWGFGSACVGCAGRSRGLDPPLERRVGYRVPFVQASAGATEAFRSSARGATVFRRATRRTP
jgi:hypothetical protein